jgi:hypothetical protein
VTVPRILACLLTLALGAGAALLAACGQSTRGGIPAADAAALKRQLEDVREHVADGQCDQLDDQLRVVDTRIDNLPRSVDVRLVQSLRDGADRLQRRAVMDCNANSTPTETEPTPTETETTPTETETTPTETETTPTDTGTTTTPPDTTSTPPTTGTVPPETPLPPPATPGGGTSPELP